MTIEALGLGPNDDEDGNPAGASPDDHNNREERERPDDRGSPDDH